MWSAIFSGLQALEPHVQGLLSCRIPLVHSEHKHHFTLRRLIISDRHIVGVLFEFQVVSFLVLFSELTDRVTL